MPGTKQTLERVVRERGGTAPSEDLPRDLQWENAGGLEISIPPPGHDASNSYAALRDPEFETEVFVIPMAHWRALVAEIRTGRFSQDDRTGGQPGQGRQRR